MQAKQDPIAKLAEIGHRLVEMCNRQERILEKIEAILKFQCRTRRSLRDREMSSEVVE
jgi:hypothetical protein